MSNEIIQANCSECCNKEKFIQNGENKYSCMSCNSVMHKCKSEECYNMIKHGVWCSMCVGDGFKKGGSAVISLVGIVAVFSAKMLLGKKGSNKS